MLQKNSQRYMTFAAPTIISCKYYYILLLWRRTVEISVQVDGLIKDKRTPITTPPYQVLSVDVTLDPPTFSLDTTFKRCFFQKDFDDFLSGKTLKGMIVQSSPAVFSLDNTFNPPQRSCSGDIDPENATSKNLRIFTLSNEGGTPENIDQ